MKYKVLFFGHGVMGQIAKCVLEQHENVELIIADTGSGVERREADIVFSASWPFRISQYEVNRGRLGAVNIHTGLLPAQRGSHPLNWALIWGNEKTGITIHKMTDTVDGGDICCQHEVPIFETDTIVELRRRVEDAFPMVISRFFDDPEHYLKCAMPQNQAHASWAQKRRPEDGEVNWSATEREIYNFIRAHHPEQYPAFTYSDGQRVDIASATLGIVDGKERCIVRFKPH